MKWGCPSRNAFSSEIFCRTAVSPSTFGSAIVALLGVEACEVAAEGVETHEHTERIPIVENSQDQIALPHVIENVLLESPLVHGIYIRRNGLYTWGETVEEARRNVEIFEFLFEVLGRSEN